MATNSSIDWPTIDGRTPQGAFILHHHPDHAEHAPQWLDMAQQRFANAPLFRQSRFARVYRVPIPDSPDYWFIKQFLARGRDDRFKRLFRNSQAIKSLNANEMLNAIGLNTEPVIAVIEYRHWGLPADSVLISEAIPAVVEARDFLQKPDSTGRTDTSVRRAFLKFLGTETGRLHAAGAYHGDLRLTNILVSVNHRGFDLYWMDNERSQRYRELPRRKRLRNLMQIVMDPDVLSRTDAMRLWHAYQAACPIPARYEKRWQRAVVQWVRKRWQERGWIKEHGSRIDTQQESSDH